MEGQPPEPDPSALRISDDDRHEVAEVLRQAAGDGRIDLAELDERLEATYRAKTYGELVPITVDLPLAGGRTPTAAPRPSVPAPTGPEARWTSSVAVMSDTRRTGRWVVQDGHNALALMGSVVLDLREARFETGEVTLTVVAVMGDVSVVVNPGTVVVLEGAGVMGSFSETRSRASVDTDVGGPVVRLRGLALMGSVRVSRKRRPGERRLGRGRSGG